MSVQNDVFLAVVNLAQQQNPYATIRIGALPPDNGLTMAISTGLPATTFMDKGFAYEFSVVLNGKHENQQTVSDQLNALHLALTQRKEYPKTGSFQITDISTTSTPSYLGVEQNSQYLYGSSLRVKAYIFAQ